MRGPGTRLDVSKSPRSSLFRPRPSDSRGGASRRRTGREQLCPLVRRLFARLVIWEGGARDKNKCVPEGGGREAGFLSV